MKKKKKGFSIEFKKAEKRAEEVIEKEVEVIKKEVKEIEKNPKFSFFLTYGWAILVIIIALTLFVWWQFFTVHSESCYFVDGSGLLCQNFDATNDNFNIEIRNLNNKTITLKEIRMSSCSSEEDQKINKNDRKTINVNCSISSGRLKEKVEVKYDIEGFEKNTFAKVTKIVP